METTAGVTQWGFPFMSGILKNILSHVTDVRKTVIPCETLTNQHHKFSAEHKPLYMLLRITVPLWKIINAATSVTDAVFVFKSICTKEIGKNISELVDSAHKLILSYF